MQDIAFKVEAGEIREKPDGRWMTLTLNGVDIFTEFVYDTDKEGNRTEEQAKKNLLVLFARRLREVLSERPN
jgi:hypothetical protein